MSTRYRNVPGAQVTKAEREYIFNTAATVAARCAPKPPIIVNIGIMWGCTLWCLRDGAPLSTLYGVDIAPDKWKIQDRKLLNATIIEGDSRTMQFDDPIDLLMIDGDHHYATVAADIANWLPRVAPGGVVLFHDYEPTPHNLRQFPELEGVSRAVDEWTAVSKWVKLPSANSIRGFSNR